MAVSRRGLTKAYLRLRKHVNGSYFTWWFVIHVALVFIYTIPMIVTALGEGYFHVLMGEEKLTFWRIPDTVGSLVYF